MSDKQLKQLDQTIAALAGQIEELEKRKEKTEQRAISLKSEIPAVMEQLKVAMVSGGDILSLEAHRKQLREELDNAELLSSGLKQKLEELEVELSAAITDRNNRFAKLASKWLVKEAQTFNQLVDRVQQVTQRLFACQTTLSELGDRQTFIAALGPGGKHLSNLKLVSLCNGFQGISDLNAQQGKLAPSREIISDVFGEVTSG